MFLYIIIGWGIVTHQNLAKASFICEYTGKLILAKNIENDLSSYIYDPDHIQDFELANYKYCYYLF